MNLYLRLLAVLLGAWRRRDLGMHDTSEIRLRVLPNDLDLNGHMNNGRYLTVLDLAAIAILVRTRFMQVVRSLGGHVVSGGVLITYRYQMKLFERYRVTMRYLGCDGFWHVFAFQFIKGDGRIAAAGMFKGAAVVRRKGLIANPLIWARFRTLFGEDVAPPELPEFVRTWLAAEAHGLAAARDQAQGCPPSPQVGAEPRVVPPTAPSSPSSPA